MGRVVIACYRPKPGTTDALRSLIRDHVATLRSLGLATDRAPITMESRDGTVVEVFEWASARAIAEAHEHPVVLAMWEDYARVCDYVPVGSVAEASELFSEFTPLTVRSDLRRRTPRAGGSKRVPQRAASKRKTPAPPRTQRRGVKRPARRRG